MISFLFKICTWNFDEEILMLLVIFEGDCRGLLWISEYERNTIIRKLVSISEILNFDIQWFFSVSISIFYILAVIRDQQKKLCFPNEFIDFQKIGSEISFSDHPKNIIQSNIMNFTKCLITFYSLIRNNSINPSRPFDNILRKLFRLAIQRKN